MKMTCRLPSTAGRHVPLPLRPRPLTVSPSIATTLPPRHLVSCRRHAPVVCANPVVAEMYNLTEEEIENQVDDLQKKLFELRVARAVGKTIKTHLFKLYRKNISQLLTVKRAKEIEQGIGKRQSRKIEKNKLLAKGEWVR